MAKASRGLGRGLDSLFQVEQFEASDNSDVVLQIPVVQLRANPYQPRKTFNETALEELKKSIIENGIIQPLIVRKSSIKGYEIIAGERRFRAAKLAGLDEVPAVLKDFNDSQMMEVALLENLQREDLSPMEEAEAYQNIMDKLNYTQEMIAERMGKSRSHIANHLRLLTLPAELKIQVSDGAISFGHAKVLLGLKDEAHMRKLAMRVASEQMSVRELEKALTDPDKKKATSKRIVKKPTIEDYYVKEQTGLLREKLGTKVAINLNQNKGNIEIDFLSLEDLERILNILNK